MQQSTIDSNHIKAKGSGLYGINILGEKNSTLFWWHSYKRKVVGYSHTQGWVFGYKLYLKCTQQQQQQQQHQLHEKEVGGGGGV
jgi:hypothetical protein